MTGGLIETEIFTNLNTKTKYLPYKQAMSEVKTSQQWDTSDPNTRAGGDLFASVSLAIEDIIGEFDWNELRLYSAVGTSLDYYHGVDGFFTFRGSIITIDVTMNECKKDYKADFILQYGQINTEEGYDFSSVAHEIANKLMNKILVAV